MSSLERRTKYLVPSSNNRDGIKRRGLDVIDHGDLDVPAAVPTSCVTFVETEHGRLRRRQRGLDKRDLQAALKYGRRFSSRPRPNGDPTAKYKYKDITYIVNERTGEEVTSYAKPVELEEVPISDSLRSEHQQALRTIKPRPDVWTSNTVLIVDRSGSMKSADMWGTRTRLGAVWLCLALDYVAARLEQGEACSTDVVSVVLLDSDASVLVEEQPCDWLLYNKLVAFYQSPDITPRGHGAFIPSVKKAEDLLTQHLNTACAKALMFLSDGKPSDSALLNGYTYDECKDLILASVKRLAAQFGATLSFTAIGIGDCDDFSVLEGMVKEAADYGAKAEFCLPSSSTASLGEAFSSVASSIASTKTSMTDIDTLKQRPVRAVTRESKNKANTNITEISLADFYLYTKSRVTRSIYKEFNETGPSGRRNRRWELEEAELQSPLAEYVAFARGPFGEGAERFAYRMFEVASDKKTIVGKPLVAKESRHILDGENGVGDEDARRCFVKKFIKAQQLACRLAEEFNAVLNNTHRVSSVTPRVHFLDCCVYQLDDNNLGKLSVLVEEKLDHTRWQKWNCNNGFVMGMEKAPELDHAAMREAFAKVDLEMIAEGSDDDDEEEEEEEEDDYLIDRNRRRVAPITFSPLEVAQAFSHFSYRASGRKRLVCDLQGVYEEKSNQLMLSDPVIHYYNCDNPDRAQVHGKTDRGKKGIALFFQTHYDEGHCGHLCRLVNRRFRRVRRQHQPAGRTRDSRPQIG